jgi:hypothetical protein
VRDQIPNLSQLSKVLRSLSPAQFVAGFGLMMFTGRQLAADSESLRVAAAGRKINQFAVWRFSFVLMMRWLVSGVLVSLIK